MKKTIFFKYSIDEDSYIESSDISELFQNYNAIYRKKFLLNFRDFEKIKTWKENKGGILISIIKNNCLVALFTLTNGENNFFELGDILKIKFKIKRDFFSKALNLGCNEAMRFFKKDGVYGYPNKDAIKLELGAGFKIDSFYRKKIYFTLFCLKFLFPFYVYSRKLHLDKDVYLNQSILSIVHNKLHKTKINKFKFIHVFCFTMRKKVFIDFFNFGFIYEFQSFSDKGDPFITFGRSSYPKSKINFQYSDNSI